MRVGRRHWMGALLIAVGLHVGIGVAILWQGADAGAKSAGMGGIEVALGPAGGAPGSVAAAPPQAEAAEVSPDETLTEAAPPETAEPSTDAAKPTPVDPVDAEVTEEPVEVPDTTPDTATPDPVDPIETTVAETVETPLETPTPLEPVETVTAEAAETPIEVPDTAPLVEAVQAIAHQPPVEETQAPEPMTLADTVPPDQTVAKRIIAPAPPKPKPPPPEPARTAPPPKPVPEPVMAWQVVTAMAEAPMEANQSEPVAPGAGGKAGALDRPEAGNSASDTSAGAMAGAEADYASVLLAWLERHKEYPRRAQQRRQQGVVLLYLVIDRNGQILDARIQESSGYRSLDKATIDMLDRATPLPPMPDDMHEERLELVVPVQYFII